MLDDYGAKLAHADKLSDEVSQLTKQRDTLLEAIQLLKGVIDPNPLITEHKKLIDENQATIETLRQQIHREEETRDSLLTEINKYKTEQAAQKAAEVEAKIKAADDQHCIKQAIHALNIYLEPFDCSIPFGGRSWDVAVKGLKVFFDKNIICTHCYQVWDAVVAPEGSKCDFCKKGRWTNNPKDMWEIIDKHKPK